jgi:hypothetical protein
MTSNAFAGSADFDSYMNANAHNPALSNNARNQDAFAPNRAYYPSEDPKVSGYKSKTSFKMGGSNTSGSFAGASSSGGSGSGSFKPSSVTSKPVSLAPTAVPAAQATNSNSQEPYFGTVGVNPTISPVSTSSSSGSTSGSTSSSSMGSNAPPSTCDPSLLGTKGCGIRSGGTNSAQNSDPYVSNANQMAQQQYEASQAAYQAQQAAQRAAEQAQRNAIPH